MLGASNHYKLPISYLGRTAGRFRNVIAMINAHAAHRAARPYDRHQLACARRH